MKWQRDVRFIFLSAKLALNLHNPRKILILQKIYEND